jgi:lipid II:glycine glycyltransferase (peptidoglycan interpeptide bridge formation enzyme)
MPGNYRRNINKASRQEIIVRKFINGDKPVSDFYNIMEGLYSNTKLLKRDKGYFKKLWNLLSPINLATIITASVNDDVVGAYLLLHDQISSYELYGGVNEMGRDMEAGYLLKWEAIKYSKLKGLKYYDHWGVAKIQENGEYDKNDELYRISLFKKGFGGNDVVYPFARVLIADNKAYHMFKTLNMINKAKLRIQKLFKA